MVFRHGGATARGDVEEDHGRGAGDPQIPAMPHCAGQRCQDVPPRFVPMAQLLPHLALPQRLYDRLKQGGDFPSPIGHRALGEGHPLMLERLT